jgi:hypothetical protein
MTCFQEEKKEGGRVGVGAVVLCYWLTDKP